jgi:hypothetical protein
VAEVTVEKNVRVYGPSKPDAINIADGIINTALMNIATLPH